MDLNLDIKLTIRCEYCSASLPIERTGILLEYDDHSSISKLESIMAESCAYFANKGWAITTNGNYVCSDCYIIRNVNNTPKIECQVLELKPKT